MIQFSVADLAMAEFLVQWSRRDFYEEDIKSGGKARVGEADMVKLFERLQKVQTACEQLHLSSSLRQLEHIKSEFNLRPQQDYGEIATLLHALWHSISEESGERHFAFIPPDKAQFFEQGALFGDAVEKAFPSTKEDIKEAGNCLACELYTAAVFHLMRVLERGLQSMTLRIHGSIGTPNWANMITDVEAEIARRDKVTPRTAQWRKQRDFFIGAATHFRYLKDAWRNYAAHVPTTKPLERYDRAYADLIWMNTRGFMQQLAKRIRERKL